MGGGGLLSPKFPMKITITNHLFKCHFDTITIWVYPAGQAPYLSCRLRWYPTKKCSVTLLVQMCTVGASLLYTGGKLLWARNNKPCTYFNSLCSLFWSVLIPSILKKVTGELYLSINLHQSELYNINQHKSASGLHNLRLEIFAIKMLSD